jgi:hypothetical protein
MSRINLFLKDDWERIDPSKAPVQHVALVVQRKPA